MFPERNPVRWTETAESDLEGIVAYIANDNVGNARQVLLKIRELCLSLAEMPMRGRVVPELKEQGIFTHHELQYPPWRIVYRISGESIVILAVFDSRRSLEDLLLERFTR